MSTLTQVQTCVERESGGGAPGAGDPAEGLRLSLTREVWDDSVLRVDLASLDGEHLLERFLRRRRKPALGFCGRGLA